MVEPSAASGDLDRVFRALADPTRRSLLQRLSGGPQTVTSLAAPYRMSLAAVSKHLQVLERAQLVKRQIKGREHHVWLRPQPFSEALAWLRFYEGFWGVRPERPSPQLEAG